MPELPEVETTCRGLAPHIVGARVRKVVVRNPSLRWPVPDNLAELIERKNLKSISRRGKYLLLEFSNGYVLWHLGMSGSLRIVSSDEAIKAHDHIDVVFSGGVILRFHDPRRFGSVLWSEHPESHKLLCSLGPEPLSEDFSGEYLYKLCRKRRVAIKQLIMNSNVVVGVGNIYANESLFFSGIHPLKPANTVSRKKIDLLVEEIKKVLASAIHQGGTTLRDFVNGEGKPGYFAQQLSVYGRAGEVCKLCDSVLKEIRLGQRSTVYCARCQKK